MKQFLLIGSFLAALMLSGCGTNDAPKSTVITEMPELVEVDLTVPQTAMIGEEVSFTAFITQGGETVDDADEVKFEIKNLTSGDKELINASLNNDQHYTIIYTFKSNGLYDITSHVTARDMHTMPVKQVTVTGGNTSDVETHGESSQITQGVKIEFDEGSSTVGEAVVLVTNVSLLNAPLEGARVRYEISRSDVDHHTWVEAPEKGTGVYQTEYTFTEPGTYEVQIHVTKGEDLHDHVKKAFIVK